MTLKRALPRVSSTSIPGTVGLFLSLFAASQLPVQAQSVTAAEDGTGTVVTVTDTAEGTQFTIDQGSLSADDVNLFHSFESFSLQTGESANFLAQPSVQNILARVSGGSPSILNGLLQVTSTGADAPNLFLMNPAGVLFGADAVLNLPANLTVTSANGIGFGQGWFDATGENAYAALSGNPNGMFAFLSEQPGSVVNVGNLTLVEGATATLLGSAVVNTGTLSASGGAITLAAIPGENVVRLSQENSLLSLDLMALEPSIEGGPTAPTLTPLDLPALLTYGGETHATDLSVGVDGSVRLISTDTLLPTEVGNVVVSGSVLADSKAGVGGQIAVLGDRVIATDAYLSASGTLGGGNLRLGGDYQGLGPLFTAQRTFVGNDVVMVADAISSGDGGRVIVWADDSTQYFGSISTRGGETAGNGGFVEISGKQNLTFQGTVDSDAPQGMAGTLLLDPATIFIVPGDLGGNDSDLTDGIINATDGPGGGGEGTEFYISEGALLSISGDTNIFLEATEEIVIEDFSGNGLRFRQGTGSVTLSAPRRVTMQNTNDSIIAPQRPIEITSSRITLGDINNAPTTAAANGGDVTISATTGYFSPNENIVVGDITTAGNVTNNNGSVNLTANDGITTGNITTGNPSNSNAGERGGDVTLTSLNDKAIATGDIETRDAVNGSFSASTDGTTNTGVVNTGEMDEPEVDDLEDDFFVEDDLLEDDLLGDGFGDDDFGDEGDSLLSDDLLSLEDDGFVEDEDSAAELEEDDLGDELEDSFEDDLEAIEDELEDELEDAEDTLDDAFDDIEFETELLELDIAVADELLSEVEGANQEDYLDYLGLDAIAQELTLEDIQTMLTNIESESGSRSAAIYINAPLQDHANAKQFDARSTQDSLEIVVVTADGTPIKAAVSGVTRSQLFDTIEKFRGDIVSSARRGSDYYLPSAQLLYQWLIAPIESELGSASIDTLVFSMDEGLRSLPIAALHDGKQFLVEKYSLGMVPSLSLINAQYEPMSNAQVLAMGVSDFERLSPLPAVPLELDLISELWPGSAFLNENFTRQNLIEQRQASPYRLIHLATHAEFKSGSADNSYIQLWDEQLKLSELHRFGWEYPAVDLLVLSACSTAVGSPEAEMGFAGLAIASGVRSAMASLWSVSDVGTLALMSEFYGQLQLTSTKANALRTAQLSMLNGEVRTQGGELMRGAARGGLPLPSELGTLGESDFSHPYYWSGFTMIGSPW